VEDEWDDEEGNCEEGEDRDSNGVGGALGERHLVGVDDDVHCDGVALELLKKLIC
jgi:hypothetical protein